MIEKLLGMSVVTKPVMKIMFGTLFFDPNKGSGTKKMDCETAE